MISPKSLLAAFGLLAIISPAFSQETPGVRAQLRLLGFASKMQSKDVFAQDPGAGPEVVGISSPIKAYLNDEATDITLTSRRVVFSTKQDRGSLTRDGELIGEVTLPADGNSSILLFLPGKPGAKAKYQVMAVPDSKKAFPAGSFHITNLSPVPVRLVLENKTFEFKPGQATLVENPPVREGGQMSVKAVVFQDNKWKEISSSAWSHPGRSRSFMILYQDTAKGDVKLKSFDDVPPREGPAPAVAP